MSDRWVCKHCFADNEETDAACRRCGLTRGAASMPSDPAALEGHGAAVVVAEQPAWRRYVRFWWIPALLVALAVGYLTSARRDDAGSLTSAGSVSVDELRVGDCFNGGEGEEITEVAGVPCSEPHEYEVFALVTHEGDATFPSDAELDPMFFEVCEPEFESYVGAAWEESAIGASMISPSEESWAAGDRSFICALFDDANDALTESLAGSAR